jgi:sensor histidine kinase regulating citrate/malate metabolism
MATDAPPLIGAGNGDAEPTLGQLVASASRDVSTLLRTEIALAKTEITGAVKFAGKGAGMFAGAAFFGLFGLGFLLTALAWGLVAVGLATWLAFLIVAVLLFIGAAILALVGKKAMTHADPTPKRAITEAQQTIATIKGQS